MVALSPASSGVCGSQPSSARACSIDGQRWQGSSSGKGLNAMVERDHAPRRIEHRNFIRIANIHRAIRPRFACHQPHESVDALVVARAHAHGIHVPPVVLRLRMPVRVAINLARGRLQERRAQPPGEAQHVDRAMHAGLGGLHRIVLVVNGFSLRFRRLGSRPGVGARPCGLRGSYRWCGSFGSYRRAAPVANAMAATCALATLSAHG